MSATRSHTPLTGDGTLATTRAYINGDDWGYWDAEHARQSIDIAMYLAGHLDLGGDERPITVATGGTYQAVNAARVYSLNADTLGGLALEAVVYYYTSDASTSVRAKIRNTTDSSDAVVGTLSTSSTVVEEVLTLTMASGVKKYQLQVTAGDTNNPVYCWGYLRLRKVAA